MSKTQLPSSLNIKLTNDQITELAQVLKDIIPRFYQDPENMKGFQKWKKDQEKESIDSK